MGSIGAKDGMPTFDGVCIKCQACIKYCPKGAKYFADEELLSHIRHVAQHYGGNKASNYFFMG
jgi:ferredoxin